MAASVLFGAVIILSVLVTGFLVGLAWFRRGSNPEWMDKDGQVHSDIGLM
jgi:hypothetical protein